MVLIYNNNSKKFLKGPLCLFGGKITNFTLFRIFILNSKESANFYHFLVADIDFFQKHVNVNASNILYYRICSQVIGFYSIFILDK